MSTPPQQSLRRRRARSANAGKPRLVQEIGAKRNPHARRPGGRAPGPGLIQRARQSKLALGAGKSDRGARPSDRGAAGRRTIIEDAKAPLGAGVEFCRVTGAVDGATRRLGKINPRWAGTHAWIPSKSHLVVGVLAFASGLIGLKLQSLLPDHHTSDRSRDMIGAISGLLGLLLALVLGTLIGSSYSFYATQKAELETLDARALQFDSALAAYGPEAQPGRDGLRRAIQQGYDMFWGAGQYDPKAQSVGTALAGLKKMDQFLLSLKPTTDAQKQLLTTASINASWIEQTRLLDVAAIGRPDFMAADDHRRLVVAAAVLRLRAAFPGQRHGPATLALGSFAVAGAIFLILELDQPYAGLFRISPAVIMQTLEALGE